jgi:hypothetical protein
MNPVDQGISTTSGALLTQDAPLAQAVQASSDTLHGSLQKRIAHLPLGCSWDHVGPAVVRA